MRRIFTIIAAAGLLWGLGSTTAVATTGESGPTPPTYTIDCDGTQPLINVDPGEDVTRWQIVEIGTGKTDDSNPVKVQPGGTYELAWWTDPEAKDPYKTEPIEVPEDACQKPGEEPTEPPGQPAASIDRENTVCEGDTGVNVTLDNSDVGSNTDFTVTAAFGDQVDEQTVTVPAGETQTVLAPVPANVKGVITVTVGGETLLEEAGTLICDSETPPPFDDDTEPAAKAEQKGGQLPFTGSPIGLIALVAAGLLTAGGATLGGLKLFRARG